MKRFPMLIVTVLLGAVVSLPAQSRERGRSGQRHRGTVVAAQPVARGHVQGPRVRSVRGIRSARAVRSGSSSHRSGRGYRPRGHYETRCERVLVPGYWTVEHHPARYGWIYTGCGYRHWGVIEPAHDHRVWVPARWETRTRRVWVGC